LPQCFAELPPEVNIETSPECGYVIVPKTLGYEQITYCGASYGSQLGQHVMRDFPESLEAVVLDGAMRIDFDEAETGQE
jgi:hypothetical protein